MDNCKTCDHEITFPQPGCKLRISKKDAKCVWKKKGDYKKQVAEKRRQQGR